MSLGCAIRPSTADADLLALRGRRRTTSRPTTRRRSRRCAGRTRPTRAGPASSPSSTARPSGRRPSVGSTCYPPDFPGAAGAPSIVVPEPHRRRASASGCSSPISSAARAAGKTGAPGSAASERPARRHRRSWTIGASRSSSAIADRPPRPRRPSGPCRRASRPGSSSRPSRARPDLIEGVHAVAESRLPGHPGRRRADGPPATLEEFRVRDVDRPRHPAGRLLRRDRRRPPAGVVGYASLMLHPRLDRRAPGTT